MANLLSQSELITARLVAATLTHKEYVQLYRTVQIIRLAGVTLDTGDEKAVQKFEVTVAEYQRMQAAREVHG